MLNECISCYFFPSRAKETKKQKKKRLISRYLSVYFRFAVCFYILGVGTMVSLLVLTINFILGFLLLSNGNSLLLILILSDNS